MAAYHPNLVSDQSSYPLDQKLASYNTAIYIDQASAAGSYSEFLSISSHKSSEFLSVGDRNEMALIPPTSDPMNLQSIDEQFNTNILDREHSFQCQGLSLSLGTEMQAAVSLPSFQYQNSNLINNNMMKAEVVSESQPFNGHKDFHTDAFMYESSGYNNVLNPTYLKAAQELLNELVKQPQSGKCFDPMKENNSDQSVPPRMSSCPNEPVANSSAERQELQNKKTKLISMFDEVNRRYKQYYHQMKLVETSLDMVVGQGAAKSYTSLALQTISRHFRSLRDAISSQIETIRRKLGDEDNGQGPLPRLRLLDQQLRKQRSLMQHGVVAWRPQRGLPQNSVSILRAWLFEHFLNPYPNDSEKITLAKQTGLTRNQVANWFINARVRLWKPMVEDIYKEEFGDSEGHFKSSQEGASKAESRLDMQDNGTPADANNIVDAKTSKLKPKTTLYGNSSGGDKVTADCGFINFQHDYSYYSDKNILQDGLLPNSLQYDISGGLSGFGMGNQVTLELGLQHHETDSFGENHSRGNDSIASDTVDFHCMDPGKQQRRFGNSQLLHDFVV